MTISHLNNLKDRYLFEENFVVTAEQLALVTTSSYGSMRLGWEAAIKYMLELDKEVKEALDET